MEHKHSEEQAVGQEEVVVVSQSGGTRSDRFLPISILVAAIVIGGSILFSSLYKGGAAGGQAAGAGAAAQGQQGAAGQPAVNAAAVMQLGPRDAILGNPNAKVTLVEYGDYQCPFCGIEFFAKTEPQIIQNYVNTGKVRYVFRDFAFLGAESTAAANAAQCAEDQNKLWPYHDALYTAKVANDKNGGGENDGFFSTAELLKVGQQLGLDMSKFTPCVQNQSDLNIVNQEKSAATAAGINSTPTFFVNGTQILGAQPYSQFQSVIDAALKA
ncbi:MAG: DsbA family protein [Patescibacteria group bacterium]|nr:DsbA family protein [Patescibacteria group bacterium]